MLFSDDDPPVLDVNKQPTATAEADDPLQAPSVLEPTQEVDLNGPSNNTTSSSSVSARPAVGSTGQYGSKYGQQRQDSDVGQPDYRSNRTEEVNVDLDGGQIQVDISDALSERDKVKYTVHTKTTLPDFAKAEMSVVREHEEFTWLHTCLEDAEEYGGFILSVRGRNKKETVSNLFKRFTQSADEVLLSGQRDADEFFDRERNYLVEYHTHIREATQKADKTCRLRRNVADCYAKIANQLEKYGSLEAANGDKAFGHFLARITDVLERLKKLEARVGTDEELKQADTFRYFMRETQAGKDLLYRRLRCLANHEAANKNLERARGKNRDIPKAEAEQADSHRKFEEISKQARSELQDLKKRRVEAFRKNLNDLAELELKHSKNKLSLLQSMLSAIKEEPVA